METKKNEFISKLLTWHSLTRSSFPWRETSDPYKILVAELFLRKTTRRQVKRIYTQFFVKYPNVRALSKADINTIRNVIKPLGMEFVRAGALKKIADIIIHKHGGKIPRSREKLLELPHVGPYITNAVMCFAYDKDYALLDTNVVRVIGRVFSYKPVKKRPRDNNRMWDFVSTLVPPGRARDFNLAILDFAASICLPRKPKCLSCLLAHICDHARAQHHNLRVSNSDM